MTTAATPLSPASPGRMVARHPSSALRLRPAGETGTSSSWFQRATSQGTGSPRNLTEPLSPLNRAESGDLSNPPVRGKRRLPQGKHPCSGAPWGARGKVVLGLGSGGQVPSIRRSCCCLLYP